MQRPDHLYESPGIPTAAPAGYCESAESTKFDSSRHLALEAPAYVRTLGGKERPFPVDASLAGPEDALAYTAPFRVLSDEGVVALRSIIDSNEKFAGSVPHRIPKCIRGLAYRSDFIRALNFCPELLDHLQGAAGHAITPTNMTSSLSQVNYGSIGTGASVDAWHLDSVPYVMVLLMSDARDMVGGELKVALLDPDPQKSLNLVKAGSVDPELISTVKYPGPGYAIFMQGARIAHAVTGVTAAREPRLTVVNSYQSLNPFIVDRTRLETFRTMPGKDGKAATYEFARHIGWRVGGQLDYLMKNSDFFDKDDEIAAILDRAASELSRARDLVSGTQKDDLPYAVDGEVSVIQQRAIALEQSKRRHSKL